jgi:hypothetical protein
MVSSSDLLNLALRPFGIGIEIGILLGSLAFCRK